MIPCSISWCVALTDGRFCPIHRIDQSIHPQVIRNNAPERHWPRTPWDDEVPWYERDNRGWSLQP